MDSPAVVVARPKIVLLGMMSKIPVPGVVWQTLHYLLGFERLGFETYYVEAHARTPSMLMTGPDDDATALAAAFIADVLGRHGLGDRWAFQALHEDGRCYGLSDAALLRLYRDAALVVNLHGGTLPLPEHAASGRLVYLETDPVLPQIELFDGVPETVDFLDQHAAFFTYAENWCRTDGQSTSTLPRTDRYRFHPTRQPVVLDLWAAGPPPAGAPLTTVANWAQPWRNVQHGGRVYGWSKNDEFRRVIDLPSHSWLPLELALANCGPEDRDTLVAHGWRVRSAADVCRTADSYRAYIQASHGEFTVAKEQNVAFRTGWFSDRSATYLASGRPVVMQDTGFSEVLPTGSGLLAFSDADGAAAAIESVRAYPDHHRAAAAAIARSHFGHDVVLGAFLDTLGVTPGAGPRRPAAPPPARSGLLTGDLVVTPTSKRPIRLDPATAEAVERHRAEVAASAPARGTAGLPPLDPAVSVVVPVHDRIDLTHLCLESILGEPATIDVEVVVVDDGSTDGTAQHLDALGRGDARLRVVTNPKNLGFAPSVNAGIAASRGRTIVLLNNDTIVTPSWIEGLLAHLADRTVGLVSACTAAHTRNCRVGDASYQTYGELLAVAAERRRAGPAAERDVPMAPLFCCAIRRPVLDRIGPLDERFEIGMFEDDDYCERLRGAGLRVVCALDVFVHHFGEGTLGDRHADGGFQAAFEGNRSRFEEKWGRPWTPDDDHVDPDHAAAVAEMRRMLSEAVPRDETVLIASRGDADVVDLVDLDGPTGRHFPGTADGAYAGHHPAGDDEAVAALEEDRRSAGAGWFFLPAFSAWWLEHYPALGRHLDRQSRLVRADELGRLYRLTPTRHDDRGSGREEGTMMASPVASACTIIARNYLGQARVLADSYLAHHPDGRFYLLVVDGLPEGAEVDPRITLVDPQELPLDDLYDMLFKYDVVELSTAVKPALLIHLLDGFGEDRVMYIDPDIMITRPMTEVFEALDGAPIVLTPHLNAPIPSDGKAPREQDILISGAYNLGFIALRRDRETMLLLDWWRERLNDLCRVDPAGGLMVDQRWIDLVPSLFPSTCILRDDTYNVAYWNLHAREIGFDGERWTCNGRPLAMFHFSGYNPLRPEVLSKHQTRTDLVEGTPLRDLFDEYGEAMLAAGFAESKQWSYGLSHFDNGIGLHAIFRRLYLELDPETRRGFGDPFSASGPNSFFEWATRAQSDRRNLSPFLETAYRLRYDVQTAFPDIGGADRERFLHWVASQGASEFGFEPELVTACEPGFVVPAEAEAAADSPAPAAQPAATEHTGTEAALAAIHDGPAGFEAALPGVNVCGYLRNESGLGSAARGYIRVLESLGVPLSLRDVSDLSVNRSTDGTLDRFDDDHAHPVNLVCVNADQHFVVAEKNPGFFDDRYNIGVWFWELPAFPEEWHDRFAHYDELWVGSSYIANTLAPVSPIPVVRIHPVLGERHPGDRDRGRRRTGIAPDEFTFLFMFDFHSYFERKNPMAVVEAFRRAFAPGDRARLVIKSMNGRSSAANFARLQAAAADDPRITLVNDYLAGEEVVDLVEACDCYVSLHRAEGAGLTMAHAMAAGKPAIATGWSGNTDFMDASNSLLVRFDLVELAEDVGPYKAGATWADPDVDHAAALMRHLFDRPEEAAALGQTAQADIVDRYSAERIARDARARLQVIAGRLGTVATKAPPIPIVHGGNGPLVGAIRSIVAERAADGRPIAVVSKGDPLLADLGPGPTWHFPQDEDGTYAGFYPRDTQTAVAHLERLRQRGAGYFLVPATAGWWLTHYEGLRAHLDAHYELVADDASCVLYRLDPPALAPADPAVVDGDGWRGEIDHVRETLAATGAWVEDLAPRVARADQQLAQLPDVLRDAFAAVSEALDDVEKEVDDRLTSVGATCAQALAAAKESRSRLDEFAVHVQRSFERIDTQQGQLASGLRAELAAGIGRSNDRTAHLASTVGELATRFVALDGGNGSNGPAALESATTPALPPAPVASPPAVVSRHPASNGNGNGARALEQRLGARPYLSSDRFFAGDPEGPMGFSRTDAKEAERVEHPSFADVFRGEREFIARRQQVYLPFFQESRRVVDLGCGRGEFLELLAAEGVQGQGVEVDGSLVRACRRMGLDVREQDALAFLREAPPASIDALFSAQFIEHVDPEALPDLLVYARRALQPGGTFVAETVNPENYEALKTFHVDLSHERPIFPQVLLHLCWEAGFESAWIFYPNHGGFIQRCYDEAGEYAVVARA